MLPQDQIRDHIEKLWIRWLGFGLAALLMVTLEAWALGLTAGLMLAQGLIFGAIVAYYELDRVTARLGTP